MANRIRKWSDVLGKFFLGLVQTAEIADGAVTAAKIADGVIPEIPPDIFVKVSAVDTAGGYLQEKLTADNNTITLTKNNPGAFENYGVKANPSAILDGKFKISASDATLGFANDKLAPGDAMSFEQLDVGGVQGIKFHSHDKYVAIDAGDVVSSGSGAYLEDKLTASKGTRHEEIVGGGGIKSIDTQLFNFAGLTGYTNTSLYNPIIAVQVDPAVPSDIKKMNLFDLNWFQKSADVLIAPSGDDFIITIPNTNKFPFDGYYSFNAHIALSAIWNWDSDSGLPDPRQRYGTIDVILTDADGTQILQQTPSHVNTLGEKLVCPAPCCCKISGTHGHFWINVQGFVHISSPLICSGRFFRLKVYRPTDFIPDTWSVYACNWEAEFKGTTLGAWCS